VKDIKGPAKAGPFVLTRTILLAAQLVVMETVHAFSK
jgi:hypothetical protein